jgi:hypothetical protein
LLPDDDPGWPTGIWVLIAMVPGGLQYYVRRAGSSDGLVLLRTLTLTFSGSFVLFGVVLAFIAPKTGDVMPWLALLVGLAVVSVVMIRVTERPLDCASGTSLAGSYRTRYFLRMAFTEVVALVAFVSAFIGAPNWMYYLGGGFALYRVWTFIAPTRGALAREQERLSENGCGLSLVRALRTGAA